MVKRVVLERLDNRHGLVDRGALVGHRRVSGLQAHQWRRVVHHGGVDQGGGAVVHDLVALGHGRLGNVVHFVDGHDADGVHWLDVGAAVVDNMVSGSDGALRMDYGD